jgi:transcriptional repressor NrdR
VIDGVRKACSGRPVDEDALARLGQQVEETVRASGAAEVPAHEVGLAILEPLSELDEIAYIRFASVYRNFTSLDDFVIEVAAMRERDTASGPSSPGSSPATSALY